MSELDDCHDRITDRDKKIRILEQELRDERTVTENMRWTIKGLLSHPAIQSPHCVCLFHESARAIVTAKAQPDG